MDKPVSILVDPSLRIEDVAMALLYSGLKVEKTFHEGLYVLKGARPVLPVDDNIVDLRPALLRPQAG